MFIFFFLLTLETNCLFIPICPLSQHFVPVNSLLCFNWLYILFLLFYVDPDCCLIDEYYCRNANMGVFIRGNIIFNLYMTCKNRFLTDYIFRLPLKKKNDFKFLLNDCIK